MSQSKMNAMTERRQDDAKSCSKRKNNEGVDSTMATRSGKNEDSMRIWI